MKHVGALVAMVALAACVAAGCSSSSSTAQKVKVEATPVGLRNAAEATLAEGTSKVELTMDALIAGKAVTMTGTGAIDQANKRFSMTFDISDLRGQLGPSQSVPELLSSAFDEPMELIVDGTTMYMKFAVLAALTGSGKKFVKVDLSANQDVGSLLGGGGSGPLGSDPSSFLRFLQGAGKVTQVGVEDVRGVNTTHFSGTYDLEDALASLPEEQRDAAERAFKGLGLPEGARSTPIPFDAWIDDEGLVRRVETSVDASTFASSDATGAPVGKTTVRVEYFDFGEPVDIQIPSDDEVQDLSKMFEGFSSSFTTTGSSLGSESS